MKTPQIQSPGLETLVSKCMRHTSPPSTNTLPLTHLNPQPVLQNLTLLTYIPASSPASPIPAILITTSISSLLHPQHPPFTFSISYKLCAARSAPSNHTSASAAIDPAPNPMPVRPCHASSVTEARGWQIYARLDAGAKRVIASLRDWMGVVQTNSKALGGSFRFCVRVVLGREWEGKSVRCFERRQAGFVRARFVVGMRNSRLRNLAGLGLIFGCAGLHPVHHP